MLRKIAGQNGSQQSFIQAVLDKAKGMYKNEAISYQGAFLTSCRQAFLPYLQRGVEALPDAEQEHALMKKIYE